MNRRAGEFAIRSVSPIALRDLVVLVSRNQPHLSWRALKGLSVEEGICVSGQAGKALSNSRIYHHVLALRCLQFVENTSSGEYILFEPHGRELAEIAHYKAKSLSVKEAQLVASGLLRCPPTFRFLGLFLPSTDAFDVDALQRRGRPLFVSMITRKEIVFRTAHQEVHRYVGEAEFREIRWGAMPLCMELGVIDELKIQPTSRIVAGQNHVAFPIVDHSGTGPLEFRQLLLGYSDRLRTESGRVPIPELMLHVCVEQRMSTTRFRRLMKSAISEYPTEFYLEKVPLTSIAGFKKAYVEVDGVWRSSVIVSGDGEA